MGEVLANHKRRQGDSGVPDWAKLSVAVAGTAITTTAIVIIWVSSTFATKIDLGQHNQQQSIDINRVSDIQKGYADAERITANNLGAINSRLTGIETKVQMVLDAKPQTRN